MDTTPADDTHDRSTQRRWLVGLLIVVSIAFIAVVLPFYGALMWAAILALLFAPLQRWLCRKFKGRASVAALVTIAGVTLVVILPLMAMTVSLAKQGAYLAQAVQSGQIDVSTYLERLLGVLPGPVMDLLDHFGVSDAASIQARAVESAGKVGQFFAGQVLSIGQNTLDFLVSVTVGMYVAFFLLRDGRTLARQVWAVVPLRADDKKLLGERFATVVRATVKGNLVVAIVQGALGGVALWVLGVPGAMLCAAVMAALSLLPAVGAALVWGPIALYLLAIGQVWQGIALALFGVFVIGLIDNILRPILVGRDTQLPDWLVLISTIGGIALVGINGFVIGPVVASLFVAVWSIYGERRGADGAARAGLPDNARNAQDTQPGTRSPP